MFVPMLSHRCIVPIAHEVIMLIFMPEGRARFPHISRKS